MKQIDDIILIKKIGRGCFGTIYLSQKKGKKEFFATKEIDRLMAEQPEQKKYLTNEIMILKILKNHPNIVKFKDTRITKNYYYIIMEYVYGYDLTKCFDIYKQKNGRHFSARGYCPENTAFFRRSSPIFNEANSQCPKIYAS